MMTTYTRRGPSWIVTVALVLLLLGMLHVLAPVEDVWHRWTVPELAPGGLSKGYAPPMSDPVPQWGPRWGPTVTADTLWDHPAYPMPGWP